MVFQVHRRIVAAALAALAVAVPPAAAIAQAEFEPVAKDEAQRELVSDIVAEQSRGGAFSPELIVPFAELAELYGESGDYDLAAAATDRALHIARVNKGLYTLDQLPLLEQAIDNAEASGDHETARSLQEELKILIWRHPSDMRVVPVLRDLGERQLRELQQLLAGELPPEVRIGGGGNDGEDPFFGNREARARWMATDARRYYAGALRVLLERQDYTSDELAHLEEQLVRINYFYQPYSSYASGRRSLVRQLSYKVAKDEPLVERVDALIRVADWDLLYVQNVPAIAIYEEAYEVLKKNAVPQEKIDEIFSPRVPVVLPTFVPNPLETHEAGSRAYIDVAFAIRKYGGAVNIRILDASSMATRNDKNELVRLIKASDFRPRLTDGELERTSSVTLRYFFH